MKTRTIDEIGNSIVEDIFNQKEKLAIYTIQMTGTHPRNGSIKGIQAVLPIVGWRQTKIEKLFPEYSLELGNIHRRRLK